VEIPSKSHGKFKAKVGKSEEQEFQICDPKSNQFQVGEMETMKLVGVDGKGEFSYGKI
jgi:hypothetical protein